MGGTEREALGLAHSWDVDGGVCRTGTKQHDSTDLLGQLRVCVIAASAERGDREEALGGAAASSMWPRALVRLVAPREGAVGCWERKAGSRDGSGLR